jgi:hypothetical protein
MEFPCRKPVGTDVEHGNDRLGHTGKCMERAASNDELLTVEDVAAKLKVKSSWVYTHADDLGAFHVGKYLRFTWGRVLERIEEKKVVD